MLIKAPQGVRHRKNYRYNKIICESYFTYIITILFIFVKKNKKGEKMERVILHSDLNNFYASVECVLNPSLKDKYVAVCGNKDERRGIVLAKNMRARQKGVKTGEPIWEAERKCPGLVIVEPRYEMYVKYSKAVREIYYRYTDKVEAFGMDECWLDVTGSRRLFGDGEKIAHMIRKEVKEKTGLTVSVGVSFNKIFAKLASDLKKPDAVTVIDKNHFKELVWPLPAGNLLNVGSSTEKKLAERGVKTIGDIAAADIKLLKSWLGKNGEMLNIYANGKENSPVSDYNYVYPAKSVGHGITCTKNLVKDKEVKRVILDLTQNVSHRLRDIGMLAGGVAVGIKNSSLLSREFCACLSEPTHNAREISEKAFAVFKANYEWQKEIRAVSVRAIHLVPEDASVQLSIFSDSARRDKIENIENAVEEIRKMYGKSAITYGGLMLDLKIPKARKNAEIILPAFRAQG